VQPFPFLYLTCTSPYTSLRATHAFAATRYIAPASLTSTTITIVTIWRLRTLTGALLTLPGLAARMVPRKHSVDPHTRLHPLARHRRHQHETLVVRSPRRPQIPASTFHHTPSPAAMVARSRGGILADSCYSSSGRRRARMIFTMACQSCTPAPGNPMSPMARRARAGDVETTRAGRARAVSISAGTGTVVFFHSA